MPRRFTYYSNDPFTFTPPDLPGLVFWVAADDESTINAGSPTTGDQVNTWQDKSGVGPDGVQATATRQPIWRDSGFGVNNKPFLEFDGSDDFLDLGTTLSKMPNYTAFAVFETNTTNSVCVIGDLRITGVSNTSSLHIRTEGTVFRSQFGNDTLTSFINSVETRSVDTPYIFALRYTDGDTETVMRANDVTLTNNQLSANPPSEISGVSRNMSIGRLGDFNGRYIDGKVAEIIIYDNSLSDANRALVETYLNNIYNTF